VVVSGANLFSTSICLAQRKPPHLFSRFEKTAKNFAGMVKLAFI
jgi:hypothetical protein